MTIGPTKLHEMVLDKNQTKLDQLEKMIEGELVNNFDNSGHTTITLPDNAQPKRYLIETVLEQYRQNGFKQVEIHDDQRDGSWIEFNYEPVKNTGYKQ